MNFETFAKAVGKLHNGKAPGRDLIVGYWYKMLTFYRKSLISIFKRTMEGQTDIPNWFAIARTNLVAKNENTDLAENYRPIACLNIMYKLYASCLNQFLQDQVVNN